MAVLDVVIGLMFVYLVLSLTCTATNELIAQWLNSRATTLEQGIWTLLTGRLGSRSALWRVRPPASDPGTSSKPSVAEEALNEAREAVASAVKGLSAKAAGEYKQYEAARGAVREKLAAAAATEAAAPEARLALRIARAALDDAESALREAASVEFAQLREAERTLLVSQFYAHPIIAGLSQSRIRWFRRVQLPSYIPARSFTTALIDIIGSADRGDSTLAHLRGAAADLPEQLRRPINIFIDQAAGDIDRFHLNIEKWYTDAMERVSGLYKRKVQATVLAIALLVSVCTGADTVRISRVLASNAAVRDAVVARAQALVKSPSVIVAEYVKPNSPALIGGAITPPAADVSVSGPSSGTQRPSATDTTKRDTTSKAAPPTGKQGDSTNAEKLDAEVKKNIAELQSIGIPLGWNVTTEQRQKISRTKWSDDPGKVAVWSRIYGPLIIDALPGLVLTTLALSLGAPFWFDMLNKIINIRAAGRAPEEKPKPPEALPPPRGA